MNFGFEWNKSNCPEHDDKLLPKNDKRIEKYYFLRNLKWKYCEKIEVKSKNTFKAKNTITKPPKESKENSEKKEYMSSQIEIKITVKKNFFFSFLKLPNCVLINI